jgi:hypothetical protein
VTEDDWVHFITFGRPPSVGITRIPRDLRPYFACDSDLVRLRHDYALKLTQKHRLRPFHLLLLPITIELGRAVYDGDGRVNFFFFESVVFGRWFHASVKGNADGDELWVRTFHRTTASEVRRLCKAALRCAVGAPNSFPT